MWVKESKKLQCEICGSLYHEEIRDKLSSTVSRAQRRDQEQRHTIILMSYLRIALRDAALAAQMRAIAENAQSEGGSVSSDRHNPCLSL